MTPSRTQSRTGLAESCETSRDSWLTHGLDCQTASVSSSVTLRRSGINFFIGSTPRANSQYHLAVADGPTRHRLEYSVRTHPLPRDGTDCVADGLTVT